MQKLTWNISRINLYLTKHYISFYARQADGNISAQCLWFAEENFFFSLWNLYVTSTKMIGWYISGCISLKKGRKRTQSQTDLAQYWFGTILFGGEFFKNIWKLSYAKKSVCVCAWVLCLHWFELYPVITLPCTELRHLYFFLGRCLLLLLRIRSAHLRILGFLKESAH